MRKFTLTLAERVILRPPVANPQGAPNLETALKALNILEATSFTEKEQKTLDDAGTMQISCPKCGESITIPGSNINLNSLPASPKEICLEEADYEWLMGYLSTYKGWPPRKPLRSMVEAVKGAERVSLSLQDPVPQGSQGRSRGKGKPGERTD